MPQEKSNSLVILGIDPGSISCGYGIVKTNSIKCDYVTSGRIQLNPRSPLHIRLKSLYEGLADIISRHNPSHLAIENIFFAKSAKAALSLGHARGAALLAAASAGLGVYEYGALEVKKAVTGYGRAEKKQVAGMVKRILGINADLSDDSADALALAICHNNIGLSVLSQKRHMTLQKKRTLTP